MKKIFLTMAVVLGALTMISGAWADEKWKNITEPNQIFEEGYIQVTGFSEEGQKRFAAIRAATVVAQRDLLEILEGLTLYGETSIKDGMLESDQIRTKVEGVLRGAMKCGENYNRSEGFAEVCMRIDLRGKGGVYDVVMPLIKDGTIMSLEKKSFQPELTSKAVMQTAMNSITPSAESFKAAPTPEIVKPSEIQIVFDGLIVDVREYPFKPALVNTIVTENDDVVFDPSKILGNVLVERGCGGFTTDPNKAKALLESWGSKNPMTLTGDGVLKMTNAKINPDDASAVYVHDKKSNLLANARVVFLLK